jgi:uncharacterized protein (DUF2126 family)
MVPDIAAATNSAATATSMDTAISATTAADVEARLQAAGIELTLGGEPTYVPFDPVGAEWSVTADGPTKLGYARALAAELQQRIWPDATLLFCSGKRFEGEVNPRWALRLITGSGDEPLVRWPQRQDQQPRQPLEEAAAPVLLDAIGAALACTLHPITLRDPLDPGRQVWAAPLSHDEGHWQALPWPLPEEARVLLPAPGPAGLRLPLQHIPDDLPRQVLTLEITPEGWGLFLPPLARSPLEQLFSAIAVASEPWAEPELSGVLPLDTAGHWQVLGITADPGVLEVNLPVCATWRDYAHWLEGLEQAAAAVGLRSWRWEGDRQIGTGGGNHLLWGGPSLETDRHPFFARPAWLVGILRYWQHHPSLSYLFSGPCVGPSSQAPRLDEGSANWLDLQLAHGVLEQLEGIDQRVAISETLRHLHADRSGNTHRSEISLDKFWNPAWPGGCQGLIEFRAIESMPHHHWSSAVALLFRALVVVLLNPERRPRQLRSWGAELHDRAILPSQLWADLEAVLAELAGDGLPINTSLFRTIWQWRFAQLLQWQEPSSGAEFEIRRALEPWPLLCDTPVEGGFTSRFVDSSMRRLELIGNAALRRQYRLWLNGRSLPWPADPAQPLALRYRHSALYPCLHPCLPVNLPLHLCLVDAGGRSVAAWQLQDGDGGLNCHPVGEQPDPAPLKRGVPPWPIPQAGACTVDLRIHDNHGNKRASWERSFAPSP